MSGNQRNEYERQVVKEVPAGNRMARRAGQTTTEIRRDEIKARMVVWCVMDPHGQPMFTEADIPAINEKSAAAIEKIVEVASRLSGLDDDDVGNLAEEMAKNPSGGSSSV